jgi:hypothetical protein
MHTSAVRSRFVIPLVLVGGLSVLALVAAVIGARSAPNGAAALAGNDPVAFAQLKAIVHRTIDAGSFTQVITISGKGAPSGTQHIIYNAPDRVEVYAPTNHHPEMIAVGNAEYSFNTFGAGWAKLSVPMAAAARAVALGVLNVLTRASSVRSSGSVFYVTTTANHDPKTTTATVHVHGGYVSAVHINENTPRLSFEFRYSNINRSPTVRAPPNAHEAVLPSAPCSSTGSSTQCGISGIVNP